MKSAILTINIPSFKTIIVMVICCFVLVTTITISHSMTLREEHDLSKKVIKLIEKNFLLLEDRIANSYLERLGKRITDVISNKLYDYKFHIIHNRDLNAFVIPGGHIFVNTGLIATLKCEEELLAILAHEIAHLDCRHIPTSMDKSLKRTLSSLAINSLAILLASVSNSPDIAKTVVITSSLVESIIKSAYSRENEMEADKMGMHYLKEAGYTGEGMLSFLKTIKKYKFNSSYPKRYAYLRTHPPIDERIMYVESWLEQHGLSTTNTPINITVDFEMFQSRIIALYEPKSNASDKFKNILNNSPGSNIGNYGYSLILARSEDWESAISYMLRAIKNSEPSENMFFELGKMYFENEQYDKAAVLLRNCSPKIFPDGTFSLAKIQIESGNLSEGKGTLVSLIRSNKNYSRAYYLLSKINSVEGNFMEMHYNLGMYYSKKRNHHKAIIHFKKSISFTEDKKQEQKITNIIKEEKYLLHNDE